MIRSFHKLLIVLYTGLVLFFIVSAYLFAFQSNPTDNRCHGDNTESCLYEENRRSIEHLFAGEKLTGIPNQPAGSPARKFDDQDYVDFDQDYFPEDALEENFLHLQPNIIDDEEEKRTGKQKTHFKDIPLIQSDSGLRDSGRIQHDFFGQAENNHVNVSRIFVSDLKSDRTEIRPFPPVYQAVLPNGLNCSKVWRGDPDEVSRAQVDLNDTLAARRSPSFYQNITENCDKYRRENGYVKNKVLSFLVFNIYIYIYDLSLCLFHNKTALKLVRMVDTEYSEFKIEHHHHQIFVIADFRSQKQDRTYLNTIYQHSWPLPQPSTPSASTAINIISMHRHQQHHHTPSSTPSSYTVINTIIIHRHQHHQHTPSSTSSAYTVINIIIHRHQHHHHHTPSSTSSSPYTVINIIAIHRHQHHHHTPSSTSSSSYTVINIIIIIHRHQHHHHHTPSSTSSSISSAR